MPALLGHDNAHAVVAWRLGRPITAAQYLADVARVATRLPTRGPVLNLCTDRYRFAVGFGAALWARHTCLLPPTHGDAMLEQLRLEYANLYLLSDQPQRALGLPQVAYPSDDGSVDKLAPLFELPDIDAAFVAARVFTSGSTGQPTAHDKTWGKLVVNARAEHARLAAGMAGAFTVVGTVPAQHMYGFESTVLMALLNGAAFDASHPFYPADIAAALQQVPAPRVLVTTPFHLRAVLDAEVVLPPLALIVSATAPLAPQLALRAESTFDAPLLEIYGCTEAGQLATRRPVDSAVWETFDGVQLTGNDAGFVAHGGHVEGTVSLSDQLELLSPQSFLLLGRSADMVNIAGKRTSLAHLDHQLNSIAGVRDGAFYLPVTAEDEGLAGRVQRTQAFVVAPGLDAAQLLAGLRDRIDPVFMPRPLHFVAEMPRNSTGKLPTQALAALAAQLAPKTPIADD
ncbi:MAG: AMP-binding protein [Burkholderiales bacterium]